MRNSKVLTISLPPQVFKKIETTRKTARKSRSEIIRDMIGSYFKNPSISPNKETNLNICTIKELFNILQDHKNDILLICLGIIVKDKKVLIGKRKEKDKLVRNLTWVFPGGEVNSFSFKTELAKILKKETNLNTNIKELIHARIIPDSPMKARQIIALYYNCKVVSGKEKSGGDLKELKWVKSEDVLNYFTTSTCDEIIEYLGKL